MVLLMTSHPYLTTPDPQRPTNGTSAVTSYPTPAPPHGASPTTLLTVLALLLATPPLHTPMVLAPPPY